uniref:Uncharacterized protein n=1 Tax=Anguilla anguilla TaxID=7936 RepID=A0A0E9W2V5_ANGAN
MLSAYWISCLQSDALMPTGMQQAERMWQRARNQTLYFYFMPVVNMKNASLLLPVLLA